MEFESSEWLIFGTLHVADNLLLLRINRIRTITEHTFPVRNMLENQLSKLISKFSAVTPPKPTCLKEEKSLICTKNSQTIESLLPDEEDLFSGVLDELGCTTATMNGDDEDFDLFSSSGGMELEENSKLYFTQQNPAITKGLNNTDQIQISTSDFSIPCEHPTFHHQSLPISHESFYNMLNPYIPQMEHMFRGSPYNTFQNHHHHLTPVIWSHSPPYVHNQNICAHSFPNLHGLSEMLPPVFSFSPIHKQQAIGIGIGIGMEESCKPDVVIPVASPNSMMSSSPHINKTHKSPKRETETTLPLSFIRPRGRTRRTSHGRHETVSCHTHTDDKKYELDIQRVLRGEDSRTTLMIKNIPNKYSSAMLLAAIDEHNQGTYDFIYLPLDFKNRCNMGYAFINMIDPLQIVQFHKSFHGKKWEKFHSGKVACLAYGRIQGKAALIAHFQESSLMNEDKCCHPILFTTNGPNAGNQEPFPLGPNMNSRRHKNRCNVRQMNENLEISSTSYGRILKHFFCDNKDAKAIQLYNELHNISISDSSNTDYCTKIKSIVDLLDNTDDMIPEKKLVSYTIKGPSPKFDYIASIICRRSPQP
ncbi:unnamed protein product [Lactuca saligna]|uniref:Mei2-like C-terminal RNA recognition motif domain-containing protein n=1 Tax=Lactuca saligna TaxID=75948 RepID=A0AA35YV74_LACSI|nr:unnamed protein product [Lactuca saligna]